MQSNDVLTYPHGRVPRAVRERQVLALAEELFAERGYSGASMDELASRAGVSKPVIYDLFGSKERLHHRLFERAADELAETVARAVVGHDDPEDQLRASALAFFEFIRGHRAGWEMISRDDAGGRHAAAVTGIRARQNAFVTALLAQRAAASGRSVDEARIEAAAHLLNGAFESLAEWWRGHPDVPAETLADWLVAFAAPGLAELTD